MRILGRGYSFRETRGFKNITNIDASGDYALDTFVCPRAIITMFRISYLKFRGLITFGTVLDRVHKLIEEIDPKSSLYPHPDSTEESKLIVCYESRGTCHPGDFCISKTLISGGYAYIMVVTVPAGDGFVDESIELLNTIKFN